jgi:hypothetical protein
MLPKFQRTMNNYPRTLRRGTTTADLNNGIIGDFQHITPRDKYNSYRPSWMKLTMTIIMPTNTPRANLKTPTLLGSYGPRCSILFVPVGTLMPTAYPTTSTTTKMPTLLGLYGPRHNLLFVLLSKRSSCCDRQ